MDFPHLIRSNTLNHLVESHVGSSHEAIKDCLIDKIVYDDLAVFRRLRIDQVDDHFVAECTASLQAQNTADIALLKELAEQALKKSLQVLEDEEIRDKANDLYKEERSGNHGSAEEKEMYDPLVRLFSHITTFGQGGPRRFERTDGMLKADEPHTFGFPSVSSDITLALEGVDASRSRSWRHRDGFGEVKPSKKQGPKPATATDTIPQIVIQCSDYARLLMSARPFMLFCVGILIFGTEFCVGIFDRDGVTFSPIHDMFNATDTFVRVVHSMACDLSIQELGHDPTVRVLTDQETGVLTGQSKYPSAVVSSVGNDPRQWCTIGSPIWTSLSFLGRGTNVWHVQEYVLDLNEQPFLRANMMIMKTAWRSSARTPESDIYLSIDPSPTGLAEFECGGDVKFPGYAGFPITVQNLRGDDYKTLPKNIGPLTPVLHRLVLRTVGRPMWEYNSEHDLLTGFSAALQAHKALFDMGILHCDISAGNILLTELQNTELRGFITDLEFAHIEGSTNVSSVSRYSDRAQMQSLSAQEATTRKHTTFESTVTVKRGAGMTGTAQFMAREIVNPQSEQVLHQAAHDVESFIWVLSFCVMRNIQIRAIHRTAPQEIQAQSKAFRTLIGRAFSQSTYDDIATERQSGCRALTFPTHSKVNNIIATYMSKALVDLFKDLRGLIHNAHAPFGPTPLTHDALHEVVDKAIASLP